MKKGLLIGAALLMTLAPVGANAAVRGFVVVGRPYIGGWYAPYWMSYWGPGYYYAPNTGEVKLDTKAKDAQLFINGSFAGLVRDRKTMHLRPGSYTLEMREGGSTLYAENIFVVAGKTLHIRPSF